MSGGEHSARAGTALDVVVLAASAGGLAVLKQVLGALPADYPVPVVVVQHRAPTAGVDALPALYRRYTPLPVAISADGDRLDGPGVHLLPARRTASVTDDGALLLGEQTSAPADAVMRSCAARFGARTCAVVLTGRLDDGAVGVRAVKRAGGRVLVQDPATADATGMPGSALATGCADLVLPPAVIGPAIVALALSPGAAELFAVPAAPWADLSAV